jgi:hypothetical protein
MEGQNTEINVMYFCYMAFNKTVKIQTIHKEKEKVTKQPLIGINSDKTMVKSKPNYTSVHRI